jgi:hypothetical protein
MADAFGSIASSIGSIVGGNDYASAIQDGANQINQISNDSRTRVDGWNSGARDKSIGYQQPYYDQGQQGLGAYGNSLGLNGQQQQQQSWDAFSSSPATQGILNASNNAISAQQNARGLSVGGSGSGAAALGNNGANVMNGLWNKYQDRLDGTANRGMQAGTNMGQSQWNYANGMTQYEGKILDAQTKAAAAAAQAQGSADAGSSSGIGSIIGAIGGLF